MCVATQEVNNILHRTPFAWFVIILNCVKEFSISLQLSDVSNFSRKGLWPRVRRLCLLPWKDARDAGGLKFCKNAVKMKRTLKNAGKVAFG